MTQPTRLRESSGSIRAGRVVLMLYFAYGSNMQWERIKERCPLVKFMHRALLPDYRLTFPRYSQNNRCWTASVEQAEGQYVWGVVYEIQEHDVSSLNQQEGYRPNRRNDRNAYIPLQCEVFIDGLRYKPLAVMTYITNQEGHPPPQRRTRKAPSKVYKARLVDGARQWRLPETYIKQLEAIEAVE